MLPDPALQIVPANAVPCGALAAFFALRGAHHGCWCQRHRTAGRAWYLDPVSRDARPDRFRAQTQCGQPDAAGTTGLVGLLGERAIAWCAVAPRSEYVRLGQTPWKGRAEDPADSGIWAATCFVVHKDHRGQRITYALARAAVDDARRMGARAIEGYPMITTPGEEITWGELHVGSRNVFAAAGLTEVSRPSKRRVVMRLTFA